MNYIDALRQAPNVMTPGSSACQGCGGELVTRKIMSLAGSNAIYSVPPGCMAGAGTIGWNYANGIKAAIHISLLDNTASFLTGVSEMYQRKGRTDVNIVAITGDGAAADCGFQSLSGAAERNSKMLFVCYDNEGYMNTGFQRSSTTSLGSRTSTTPTASVMNGKEQHQKYLPMVIAMHNVEYCATASPSNMADFVAKVQKGIAYSKKGFAFIHVFAACPTGWGYSSEQTIAVSRKAVQSNYFPLWEKDEDGFRLNYINKKPIPVSEYVALFAKFNTLSPDMVASLQKLADDRYAMIQRLCAS